MRKRFEQQLEIGMVPIGEVKISKKSRHQLPPMLMALQYIFNDEVLNEELFAALEKSLMSGKQMTGRPGMSLWEIFVLASTRHNLEADYDSLLDMANNHKALRGILGVDRNDFSDGKEYELQTLKDNVSLLEEDLLRDLNELVVKAGHGVIKKKEGVADLDLSIKVDSYVLESNIHFPTDLNLMWDSGRKVLDIVNHLENSGLKLAGFRKKHEFRRKLKEDYRRASEIHRKKGKDYKSRLQSATTIYLDKAKALSVKSHLAILDLAVLVASAELSIGQVVLLKQLVRYVKYLDQLHDLTQRRIIKGEVIPHEDKIFSIFEPHVEWINKGKMGKSVELGHPLCISSDQYQFILDYELMIGMGDSAAGMALAKRLPQTYQQGYELNSISFDRGFYAKLLKKQLEKDFDQVIMPKSGKKSAAQELEESEQTFVQLRKAHSAVESNINQLEHTGLGKCPDKGLDGFKRYAALGILAYNLHRLGKLLLEEQREQLKKEQRKKPKIRLRV
jgi:hypothetical protein